MSEFSQSFHLLGGDEHVASAILRAAGVAGIVHAPKNGWVTLVPDLRWDARGERAAAVGRASTDAPLVHWDFAEDHSLRVTLHVSGERRGCIEVSFETRKRPRFDHAAFAAVGLLLDHAEEIAAALERRERSYLVAERLGLPWYSWVEFESAERAHEQGELAAGSLRVAADGTVSLAPPREPPPPPVRVPDWMALAEEILAAWRAAALVSLADDGGRARLTRDLAALLGSYPGPSAVERFLFEHDEVLDVHGSRDELARAYAAVLRRLAAMPDEPSAPGQEPSRRPR